MQSDESWRRIAARFWAATSRAVTWTQRAAQTGSMSPAQMGGHPRPVPEPHRPWLLDQVHAYPAPMIAAYIAVSILNISYMMHDA